MSTTHRAPAPRTPGADGAVERPGVPLAAVAAIACLAQFMVVLDSSIVTVALPAMRADLGLSTAAQQWVVDGYLIAFGGLLLLASRAGDLLGRRRVFGVGLVVFTVASLLGGVAQGPVALLVARVIQGAGAAALGPSSLSLITASHPNGPRRTRALTWWGVAASSAGAAGIVLGGILTSALSWRWVMFVNVPVGAGLLVAMVVALRPSATAGARARLDVGGAVTASVAAAALVLGVSTAPQQGWGSAQVVLALVLGIATLLLFVAVERRAVDPLVPTAVLAHRDVRVGLVLTAGIGALITAPLFFLSLYLQQVLGDGALRAGLSLLPMLAIIGAGVLASQRLVARTGPRPLLVGGGITTAVGLVWLAHLPTHAAYVGHVLAPSVLVGAGLSVMMMPALVAATTGVRARDAGIASGLVNMSRQIGAAVGLAVVVTIASTVTRHSAAAGADAVVHGYDVALLVLAAVAVLTAAAASRLRPSGTP